MLPTGAKVHARGVDGTGRGEADKGRCVSWFLEVLVWRCRARLPIVLVSFLEFLMTARVLVAGSLLVKGNHQGNERERFCSKFLGELR